MKKEKIRKHNKAFIMGLSVLVLPVMMSINSNAADTKEEHVDLVVNQSISGTTDADTFEDEYVLCPVNEDTPMPESSQNENYVFTIKGNSAATLETINYSHAGIYEYKLWQLPSQSDGIRIDTDTYIVTVAIGNTPEGGLDKQVFYENDKGYKTDDLSFKNEVIRTGGSNQSYTKLNSSTSKIQNTQQKSSVKTGDNNVHLIVLTSIMAIAFVTIVVLFAKRRRRN